MKYTVCRDLKSDHESLVERHLLEVESTTHSQKKKDVIHERKKKSFPLITVTLMNI